jgi:uncharacterized protein YbaP (TraB family)
MKKAVRIFVGILFVFFILGGIGNLAKKSSDAAKITRIVNTMEQRGIFDRLKEYNDFGKNKPSLSQLVETDIFQNRKAPKDITITAKTIEPLRIRPPIVPKKSSGEEVSFQKIILRIVSSNLNKTTVSAESVELPSTFGNLLLSADALNKIGEGVTLGKYLNGDQLDHAKLEDDGFFLLANDDDIPVIMTAGDIESWREKQAAKNTKTSVWEISNGDNVLYIGGTIHILRESDYPLPSAFDTAFNDSEIIVFETSADDPLDLLNSEEIKYLIEEGGWVSVAIKENDKIGKFMDFVDRYSAMVTQNENVIASISDPAIYLTEEEQEILNQIRAVSLEYQKMLEDEDVKIFVKRAQELDAKTKESEDIKIFFESFLNPDFKSLETILSKDTFELLESLCEKYDYSIADLKFLKPYLAYSFLSVHILTQFAKVDGVDVFFEKKAKEYDKKIEYFETPDFQYNLLANLGSEYGDAYYAYIFRDLETGEGIASAFDQMIVSWKSGLEDDATMFSMLHEKENFPAVYEAMITNRNNAWIPVIENYLGTAPVEFVLVGNGHIHGPDGLLAQLEKRGYKIEQK